MKGRAAGPRRAGPAAACRRSERFRLHIHGAQRLAEIRHALRRLAAVAFGHAFLVERLRVLGIGQAVLELDDELVLRVEFVAEFARIARREVRSGQRITAERNPRPERRRGEDCPCLD